METAVFADLATSDKRYSCLALCDYIVSHGDGEDEEKRWGRAELCRALAMVAAPAGL